MALEIVARNGGEGHALSTPFGALKHGKAPAAQAAGATGHALSTPFGALKPRPPAIRALQRQGHALSTPFGALKLDF